MTFQKYASLYIQLNEDEWKPSYLDKNKGIVETRFEAFKDLDIKDLHASDIKLWYKNINDVGNKSKRNYLSVLKGILDVALHDEVIQKNPMIHVKFPKYKAPRIHPFSADEVKMILEASKDLNFNFVYYLAMGFYAGMRTGEILALKRNEVDLKKRTISIKSTRSRFGEGIPKTFGSKRTIPILDSLYPYILKMLENGNTKYVLTNQYDRPYRDSHVFCTYWWKPLLESLRLPYRRIYDTRHTFATNMLYRKLCSPAELAQYLGHSNVQMVYEVYVSYLDSHFDKFDRSIAIYS